MFTFTRYDFGYSWPIAYGLAIPFALALGVGAFALWRHWPRWVLLFAVVAAVWAAVGLVVINIVWGINSPMALPTTRFLESGSGHVLDAGAGSGRAGIGLMLVRPRLRVTALDIYDGYWGIEGNTPQRFMANARIAGVEGRASAQTGDMRAMPFADATFDGVISSYAIDHLDRDGRARAMSEVARVLKPGGEFLLMIVDPPWWTWLVSPPMAHHAKPDPVRWRALFEPAGLTIHDEGTAPITRYWLATKQTRRGAARPGTMDTATE